MIYKKRINNKYYFPIKNDEYYKEYSKLNRIVYNDLRVFKRHYVYYVRDIKTNVFNSNNRYYVKNDGSIISSNIVMSRIVKRFKRFNFY